MMEFLDIPEEVIIGSVCPNLTHDEVLRMRLVNKLMKRYADDHLNLRVRTKELEINETDRSLEKFMVVGVCTGRLYLNVTNPQFFTDCQLLIEHFLENYGHKITRLRVRYFHAFTVNGEMEFYGALRNLKRLELEEVDATKRNCAVFENEKRVNKSPFPDNFKELESLKLGLIHSSRDTDVYYQWDMFDFCEKLAYFKHALYPNTFQIMNDVKCFGSIPFVFKKRKEKFPNGPRFEYYDVENLQITESVLSGISRLLNLFVQEGASFINFNGYLLEHPDFFQTPILGEPIVTLQNISAGVFHLKMPNLIKVSINDECKVMDNVEYGPIPTYPKWRKLKSFSVFINKRNFDKIKLILNYLFEREETVRKRLRELRFQQCRQIPEGQYPFPKVRFIVYTCPYLTKLTLVNYTHPAPNKAYSTLWEGLLFLREICLDNCISLGNAGFVGIDIEEPAFLNLKRLNKLTLKGFDKMPKITDTFFKVVLCHMKLTQFIVQSDAPVASISQDGIGSLVTGNFGKSIDKFPFYGWSLSGVSEDEFRLLGSKFRSSYRN